MKYDDLNNIFKKKFVITVEDNSTSVFAKRKRDTINRLNGVEFEFFKGVDGRLVDKKMYEDKGSRLTYGQLGCALSHLEICKKMINEDIDIALVMEDDCDFNDNISNIKEYMEMLPSDWGLLYVGYLPNSYISNPNYKKLYKITKNDIKNVCGTHCMAMTKDFAKIVHDFNKDCLFTADGVLTEIVKKLDISTYAVVPSMAEQYPPPTVECTLSIVDREMIDRGLKL